MKQDFAVRHGLPLPALSPILQLNLPQDPGTLRRLFVGYDLIQSLRISEDDFFHYVYIDKQRLGDSIPCLLRRSGELNEYTLRELDHIQETVGADIFNIIYEQLRTDELFRALFRDEELLANATLYWVGHEKNIEPLGEQPTNIECNEADSTSDVVLEDIGFPQTNVDFSSTISRSHGIKTPSQNYLDSNLCADEETSEDICSQANADFLSTTKRSYAIKIPGLDDLEANSHDDDGKVEGGTNSQSSTDLSEVQSINPIDFLEIELNCSPTVQFTNQDNNENPSSVDLFQGHLDKSNESPDSAFFKLPNIQKSFYQIDEETPRKEDLAASRTSTNNATHSSLHAFKGKSRENQSEESYEVLEEVSNAQPRVRKFTSQDDDAKSRKKIRLQENLPIAQPESNKGKSSRKDKSRCLSRDSWPLKPRKNSCIVM